MGDDGVDFGWGESTDRTRATGDGRDVSRRSVLGGLTGIAAAGLSIQPSAARRRATDVPTPSVEGPIEGGAVTGEPQGAAPIDVSDYGYVEEEYFLSGEARHDDFFLDGDRADETAEYRTRILVYRPRSRRRFNRSVYAEWFNVSTQMDAAVAWPNAYDSLMRNGTAVALVSAQAAGVDASLQDMDLVSWDPERYGDLHHPGDEYALDIFAQAVNALKRPGRGWARRRGEPTPLGGLNAKHAMATGHSQSAIYMLRYINMVAGEYGLVDGFLPAGSFLTSARADLAPILWFNSEDEALGLPSDGDEGEDDDPGIDLPESGLNLGELEPGREDEDNFMLWEVAGASHVNYWLSQWSAAIRQRDFAGADVDFDPIEAGQYGERPDANYGECEYNYVPVRYAYRAATEALREWVARGNRPAPADRLVRTVDDEGNPTLARDEHGNALGGLRLPVLEAPVATYDGSSCDLFGRTFRFDEETIDELYPTHEDYVDAIERESVNAIRRGHFRARDARYLIDRAEASSIGE